ncbi:MAG: tetratricopeptide repeat protein, partial [Carboxydocellales bacterium]
MTNAEKSVQEVNLYTAIVSLLVVVGIVISVGYFVGQKFFWKPAVPVDPYAFEIAQAEQKVQLDPKNVKNQMLLSYAYLRKGDGQSALKTLKLAEKLEPKNKQIAYNLGLAYNQLKNYPQAIKYLEPQLTGGIIDFNLNYQLGDAYMGTKQYAKAVERY